MPGFYADGEYDIAGFIVGLVERSRIVDGRTIVPGDALIGLASSGLHTNGYSLARHVLFATRQLTPDSMPDALDVSLGDALLATHRSYLRAVTPLLDAGLVKGMAHITGGGITENLPRILPDHCAAVVDVTRWRTPPIFTLIQTLGPIAHDEMYRAFNMGIGLILACQDERTADVLALLADAGERDATLIGRVVGGDRSVRYAPVS
jgi:phosphoribosylformylglycinamidine cyclo-ligase